MIIWGKILFFSFLLFVLVDFIMMLVKFPLKARSGEATICSCINFYVKVGGPSDAHRSEFHDVKRSFVKESEGQLLRKLNKWPIRICPSLQSWKIRIINQPQKGSSKEQAAQKRAFDSINQTFLILIPWSHHHHHRGKHKKNKTFHSPVWRCQTNKSSICAFARATHHLGMWKKWKSTIVISRRAFRIQFLN